MIEKAYFQGLPIPMAAGIVASSVLAFTDLGWEPQHSYILLLMTTLLAFVMVSTFRYRSFKDIDLKGRLPFKYLIVGVLLIVGVALRPEVMLFVVFMAYATLGAVFGILGWGRPLKRNPIIHAPSMEGGDDLHEEVDEDDEDELTPNHDDKSSI